MTRLPPLNALRAFEAASRRSTFTAAADELHVTHGAVSRQVLALEERLKVALFVRGPRGLLLTAEGAKLARAVGAAFQMLTVAVEQLAADAGNDRLRLSVPPTFAMRWLIPRLGELHRAHPTLRLELSTSTAPPDRASEDYDAAIRRIEAVPKGWVATRFLDGRSVPVCSPAYRKRRRLRNVRELTDATLIVTRSEPNAWRDWLRAHGIRHDAEADVLTFEELYFAAQAALDSLGVALVPSSVVDDELRAGRLVALAPPDPASRRAYALLAPRLSPKRAVIDELAAWLRPGPS